MNIQNKIAVISALITFSSTIALFFIFKGTENNALFYMNLGLVLWSEILLMGNLGLFIVRPRLFNVQSMAVSYIISSYAVCILGTVPIYNLLLRPYGFELNWYIGLFLALTAVFSAIAGATAISAHAQTDINRKFEDQCVIKKDLKAQAALLPRKLSLVLHKVNLDNKDKNNLSRTVKDFSDAVSQLPVLRIEKYPESCNRIIKNIDNIDMYISEIKDKKSTDKLIEYIETAKVELGYFI